MKEVKTMLWITDTPFSSVGYNTIRQASEKYEDIEPGDTIRLELRKSVDAEPFMTEELKVCSVLRGQGEAIIDAAGPFNHSMYYLDREEMSDVIRDIYGTTDGEFIAISFGS